MIDRLEWSPVAAANARALAARTLYGEADGARLGTVQVAGQIADPPFYPSLDFYHLELRAPAAPAIELFVLANERSVYLLDGTVAPLQMANRIAGVEITAGTAAEYLRLHLFAVRGDEGPFLLFEVPAAEPGADDAAAAAIAALAVPLESAGMDDEGRFLFDAHVRYGAALFRCRFAVATGGGVLMLADEPLAADVPPALFAELPPLQPATVAIARLESSGAVTPTGAAILRTLVQLLLEQALGKQAETRLLAHFNARLQGHSPLDRFAHLLTTAAPVIAIESTLPFVEESVAQIARDRTEAGRRLKWVRPDVDHGDDTRLRVAVPDDEPVVLLLPFHSYRSMVDTERVAHEIAAHEVACLIGCERVADLPASLRQVVDLVLRLPRLEPDLFATLFRRVIGSDPPEGWRDGAAHWVSHVHHSDFQHPQGLQLTAEEALAYVRDRARQRLRDVEPADGLGLADLHGLGEARAFAEDLIADIHEAVAGRLDWRQVDRGVLLVGAPGTGKTTLARAVAKDCGIRFISASAASWQAAGHLGDHIRALRADFALARRFAPSILFIDEIDSVGSRESFSGDNAQYSTQVVNALLEQLQGMDPAAPVIVIAASNHADRVDPALKRAGRLDRTIEIPRPNAEALAAIFRHYLRQYARDEVDADVDARALGGLTLGLTGADVELFVRGAQRRARRAGRPIRQADLMAEVTSKPRDPSSSPRLTPAEVRRVAVHEAGHALASCLGDTLGQEISYVSIVPRADGTLGFVARMPSERVLVTRREYLERLEVVLAGRAAEEVVFGEDGVTGGAQHDLMVATRSALLLTTQYGLGPDGKLLWSDSPSASQREEASRVLSAAYAAVLARLREHAARLDTLAAALVHKQELTGQEVRALVLLREVGEPEIARPAGPRAPAEADA